ncbi:hypothetical protein AAWM_11223 [Aspergillus awamori]|uniref:Uncharacterized protein n=1 Tax=Aspergillus awamori TaxID=105351 RepID=A0A401L9Z3_ASPAW|nr:hypothetical protein AAWM_11223 [Aspergillus awamori]
MPQSAAIHGHPGAPLAASLPRHPRASHPPSRPVSPRGASHHPISPGQLVNSLRQHARTQLSAGTGRLPAWPPAVSAGRSAAPALQVLRRSVAAILRANVLWSESDSWGRPPAHRVLATVSRGQLVNGPLSRTRARTASLP